MSLFNPLEIISGTLDQLFTSDDERLSKQALLERISQNPQLMQLEINKEEAKNPRIFISGWRSFIGWACGVNFVYNTIVRDWLIWIILIFRPGTPIPPETGQEITLQVLFALLGVTMATIKMKEKINNVR